MSFMKTAVVNSQAPKDDIISVLRKRVGGYETARSHKTIHASDITKPDFCPRHLAFLDLFEKGKKGSYIATAMQMTFDIGNMTATLVREEWAGESAIGNWVCRRCSKSVDFTTKPKVGCAQHKDCIWQYKEMNFVSKEYGVSGSIDVLFKLDAPKPIVTELKIIRVEDFETMVAPLPEHRIRTSLYLKLVADSDTKWKDSINLHEARVLYVSRGYGKKHLTYNEILPLKEYQVVRDDALLSKPLAKAKQIKIFREEGLMPQGICATTLDKTAKACGMCAECFSGKYPPQQDKEW